MTMKRKGQVLIDANILIYGSNFHSADVFQWIDSLYEEVIIHAMVLEEIKIVEYREKIEKYINESKWKLFDPDDEQALTDDLYDIYEGYVLDMRKAFSDLDEKKKREGRPLKNTNDLGEIHSLAAAKLLGASIICSNDYDISEVIQDEYILITFDENMDSVLLKHDTLLDFCCHVVNNGIASRGLVRKFLKASQPEKIQELDKQLEQSVKIHTVKS